MTDGVTSEPEPIRVLVVDDQELFRRGITMLLTAEPGIEVVGEAGDGLEAAALAESTAPDVVLLDVRLPDGSGVDVVRTMRGWAAPPMVVLTSTADYTHAARECGATGFISKRFLSGPVLRAVIETA